MDVTQADGEISVEIKATKRADWRLQGKMKGNSIGLHGKDQIMG